MKVLKELQDQVCYRCTYHFMMCKCKLIPSTFSHGGWGDLAVYGNKYGNYIPCIGCIHNDSQKYIELLYKNPGRITEYFMGDKNIKYDYVESNDNDTFILNQLRYNYNLLDISIEQIKETLKKNDGDIVDTIIELTD